MADEQPTIAVVQTTSSTTAQIQSGEQTSEHAVTQAHQQQASIVQMIGGATVLISGTIDLLQTFPQSARMLHTITILGGLMALLARLSHLMTTIRYIDGRSMVKTALA